MDDLVNENLDFPFPDAVQEFSAQTSNMGVEQGGLSGGALNVVTKSGTNSRSTAMCSGSSATPRSTRATFFRADRIN